MYRALRLLSRSRRLLRTPSAGAAVSEEAGTLRRCAPNVARMVSEHLGLGLAGVTFMSACPRCPRGPGRAWAQRPRALLPSAPGRRLQPGVLGLRAPVRDALLWGRMGVRADVPHA